MEALKEINRLRNDIFSDIKSYVQSADWKIGGVYSLNQKFKLYDGLLADQFEVEKFDDNDLDLYIYFVDFLGNTAEGKYIYDLNLIELAKFHNCITNKLYTLK